MSSEKHHNGLYAKGNLRTEWTAGIIGYLATVYIVIVNGSILSEAGISLESGMIATILACFTGTLLMGLFAKLPLIVIPGMGINALFAYSIVQGSGLTFQEGLAVVLVAGLLFLITAFSRLGSILRDAIPDSLKHGITAGIGLFLILLGLEKNGLVVSGENSVIALGNFTSPQVVAGVLTLFLAIFLFIRNIPANFLITMVLGTLIAYLFGLIEPADENTGNILAEAQLFLPSFSALGELAFWVSVFPLAMILIFENMGILHGQLEMLNRHGSYRKAYQVTAFSSLSCAFFGTSPTISAAENAAVIASKGRTGITAIIASVLFLGTIFIIPLITMIPDTAISPILIIVGMLMAQSIRHLPLENLSESLPGLLIIVMIPFTYSIADGMAFGFIAYPIAKIAQRRWKELSVPLAVISFLFLGDFLIKIIGI
ncbi:NCS2 family permease [Lentibacillus sediminis]|uniref:NCS2 family permease n=1 Tax=Lentibacillus sediminis TaxID=1940529 RepID=UPI000C1C0ED7|nr:NCS2 family permease [Lentibacillus sediminis]